LSTKYEVYAIKIIPLETSFEYKSNGIIFVAYNSYFLYQIYGQSFFSRINRYGVSTIYYRGGGFHGRLPLRPFPVGGADSSGARPSNR
jgi:hypothetical protein